MIAEFPRLALARQVWRHAEEPDAAASVRRGIMESRLATRLRPGARVALAIGSRGVVGIDSLARAAVDAVRGLGFEPFIVAAMGSHGGGTADGQRSLLAEFGITEATMGCLIADSMETVVVGQNSFGLPIHFAAAAAEADGIVLLNRIKPHTSFHGKYESGLLKMLAVGLGKREGAAQVHRLGLPGLARLVPEVGEFLLRRMPVVLGIGILENACERTALVAVLEPDEILEREPVLLGQARELMGRLPFDQIDLLLVAELGKNFSGTGLDPNVIGRLRVETMPETGKPSVTRLAVFDVAPESRGNALGVGLADLITARLRDAIDPKPMLMNSLTANFLTRVRVPIAFSTDREVLRMSLDTCWRTHWSEARVVMIPNTLELEWLYVSDPIRAEIEHAAGVAIVADPAPIVWRDDDPDRIDFARMFPDSQIARRGTRSNSSAARRALVTSH
jgi:hypothetical protein